MDGEGQGSLESRGDASEILRFYGLTDRWMARDLVRKASCAIGQIDAEFRCPGTMEHRLLFGLLPLVAQALEAGGCSDAFELRLEATSLLMRSPRCHGSDFWRHLTRDVVLGNPLMIALDRCCPPSIQSDWSAARIHQQWTTAGRSGGLIWTPDLLALVA